MIIFAAEYNPCIYESGYSILSLHKSYDSAASAALVHKTNTKNDWKELGHDDVPDYEQWRIKEYKVLE